MYICFSPDIKQKVAIKYIFILLYFFYFCQYLLTFYILITKNISSAINKLEMSINNYLLAKILLTIIYSYTIILYFTVFVNIFSKVFYIFNYQMNWTFLNNIYSFFISYKNHIILFI